MIVASSIYVGGHNRLVKLCSCHRPNDIKRREGKREGVATGISNSLVKFASLSVSGGPRNASV